MFFGMDQNLFLDLMLSKNPQKEFKDEDLMCYLIERIVKEELRPDLNQFHHKTDKSWIYHSLMSAASSIFTIPWSAYQYLFSTKKSSELMIADHAVLLFLVLVHTSHDNVYRECLQNIRDPNRTYRFSDY